MEQPGMMKLEMISKYPAGNYQPTPLLFVHGMMHGAWCWDAHFLNFFVQNGYEAHAVNLRGHGDSEGYKNLRWTSINHFVEDVANTVKQLSCSPILIGHSMGGFIVQKYLEKYNTPGAILLSSPSPAGLLSTAIKIAFRHPDVFIKVNLSFSLLPVIATPQLAREAFFSSDIPYEQFHIYWKKMQDESYRAFLDMVMLNRIHPGKVKTPILVLGAERDNMLSRSDIMATGRAYNTQAEIIPGVAHDSMLEQNWERVAKRILKWINECERSKITPLKKQVDVIEDAGSTSVN